MLRKSNKSSVMADRQVNNSKGPGEAAVDGETEKQSVGKRNK